MKISVCIATYNGEKFISEQLASILCQLSSEDEVIISDDSSLDNTIGLIKLFNDDRIKILENQNFKNPIFNFENALINSTGDIIFLSDQDDIWLPDKVKLMKPIVEKSHIVLCNCSVVNEKMEVICQSFFLTHHSKSGLWNNMLLRNSYMGCCMAFSRELLNIALPFPKNIPMHDSWIGLLGEIYFKPIFVEDCLVLYRRHSYNVSQTGYKSMNPVLKQIRFRVNLLLCLILRLMKPK